MDERLIAFKRILDVMDELREKCPWDQKQTMDTLKPLTIEECYELIDAINEKDDENIKEELGDVLLHIVFYSKIASEQSKFTITNVINDLCEKLIERHPHIYGNVVVNGEEDVKRNWEEIKMKTKKQGSVLAGVPKGLPALIKSLRIQEKAAKVGFEWEKPEDVWAKVLEEIDELKEAVQENDGKIGEEFGDVLFALTNYARFVDVDPEDALEQCNRKFMKRFQYIEKVANAKGLVLKNMTLGEMDALWNEAKYEV